MALTMSRQSAASIARATHNTNSLDHARWRIRLRWEGDRWCRTHPGKEEQKKTHLVVDNRFNDMHEFQFSIEIVIQESCRSMDAYLMFV